MTRPSRNLPRITASFFVFLAAMATASADNEPPPATKAPEGKPPDPKPAGKGGDDGHPLQLTAGVDTSIVRSGENGFTRVNTLFGLSLIPARWLELSTVLRVGYADFKYHGKAGDDAAIDAELSRDGHVTLTSGVRFLLLEKGRVRWTLFGEYETSFGSDGLSVDAVTVTLGGAGLDLTDYFRQHGQFAFSWRRIAVGTGIRIETGRVSPTFSVAFERLSASVDVNLDDEARNTISAFGKDPSTIEKRHVLDHNAASFYPGIDIRMPYRMHLAIEGMIVPIPDGWAFGAGIRYSFRP